MAIAVQEDRGLAATMAMAQRAGLLAAPMAVRAALETVMTRVNAEEMERVEEAAKAVQGREGSAATVERVQRERAMPEGSASVATMVLAAVKG